MGNKYSHAKALLNVSVGTAGAALVAIFGECNDSLFALIVLMCIDFITGLIVAGIFNDSNKSENGGLSSKICLQGIAKKVCTLLLVAMAYQAEILLSVDYIRTAIIWGLCANEMISVTENSVKMKILPESVQKILEKAIGMLNKEEKEDKPKRTRKSNKKDSDDKNE